MISQPLASPSWVEFVRRFVNDYSYGQHAIFIAQNGRGKTHLALTLLNQLALHKARCAIAWTKPDDDELERFARNTHATIVKGTEKLNWKYPKDNLIMIRPTQEVESLTDIQEKVFSSVLYQIWRARYWVVFLDELRYLTNVLNMSKQLQIMFTQIRSSKVGLWSGIQRPAWVIREAITESRHFFIGEIMDNADYKRLAEIVPKWILDQVMAGLPPYTFAYYNSETKYACLVRAPK